MEKQPRLKLSLCLAAFLALSAVDLVIAQSSTEQMLEEPAGDQVEPPNAQQQPSDQPAVEAEPVAPAVSPTDPSGGEHEGRASEDAETEATNNSELIFGDGLAQWVMAITGLGAVLLSAWAVWLLKGTLDATKDAAKSAAGAAIAANRANEIMRAEQRPWLVLRRDIECDFGVEELDPSTPKGALFQYRTALEWRFKLENLGKAPAFGIKVKTKVAALSDFFVARNQFAQFVKSLDHERETDTENTVFQGQIEDHGTARHYSAVGDEFGARCNFYLFVAVLYRSQEGDIKGCEARLLEITFDQTVLGPYRPKLLEFSRDRVTR